MRQRQQLFCLSSRLARGSTGGSCVLAQLRAIWRTPACALSIFNRDAKVGGRMNGEARDYGPKRRDLLNRDHQADFTSHARARKFT